MIYLIQQRQLNKQSQTLERSYMRSSLLQTYRRRMKSQNGIFRHDINKARKHIKLAFDTNLTLGDFSILYERMIANLKGEVKVLKAQKAKDNYFKEEIVFLRNEMILHYRIG